MKTKNIKQSIILNCTPDEVFEAWMDSRRHGEMVDGSAKIDPKIGGEFEIWDGAIKGKTLELDPKTHRIVQEWRYAYDDWSKNEPSKIVIELVPYKNNQTKLNFSQSNIPNKYFDEITKGWEDYYWKPMRKYFSTT